MTGVLNTCLPPAAPLAKHSLFSDLLTICCNASLYSPLKWKSKTFSLLNDFLHKTHTYRTQVHFHQPQLDLSSKWQRVFVSEHANISILKYLLTTYEHNVFVSRFKRLLLLFSSIYRHYFTFGCPQERANKCITTHSCIFTF